MKILEEGKVRSCLDLRKVVMVKEERVIIAVTWMG